MRELLLMRHAKSDWDAPFGSDRDRPLNRRGEHSGRAVGRFLASTGRVPELAVTSPAVRAESTLDLAMSAGAWRCEKRIDEALYGGGPEGVLEAARRHAGEAVRVMVVGHEPVMSSAAARLMGGGSIRFPTAAVAGFRVRVTDWDRLGWTAGELEFLMLPRLLLAAER
jgi:phosphohistidine phosphatase